MPTREQCKSIIFKTAMKCGVSPKLIAEKLLSDDDKRDMVEGVLTAPILHLAVTMWVSSGKENCNETI